MKKTLNKKIDNFMLDFKNNIKKKIDDLNLVREVNEDVRREEMNKLLQFIYDYDKITIEKTDLSATNRKPPAVDIRCCALTSTRQQCIRKKMEGSNFCKSHEEKRNYGVMEELLVNSERSLTESKKVSKKNIYTRSINGIIYYMDAENNVYKMEDIINNIVNPDIIGNYMMETNTVILK